MLRRLGWMVLSVGVWAHAQPAQADLSKEMADLRATVQRLQARVDDLERRSPAAVVAPVATSAAAPVAPATAAVAGATPATPDLLRGTTVNVAIDGYYGYNFNAPIGRVNNLRAYDVSSNAFSLNQANLVIENAPDPAAGKRFGARLDLQFGQATATLQGNAANEPRPEIYRSLFQVYGTYVAPLGKGLTVDFGKWGSSIGIEGNYTKDQMNYSRSMWFDFLPFYHMGIRASWKATDKLSLNYWVVNGTQQVEPVNGFKDQLVGFNWQPAKTVSWTFNYYRGQEHPDIVYLPNGNASLPSEQGLPFKPVTSPAQGKLHIFDSYVSWQVTPNLTLAADADYVIQRLQTSSQPQRVTGGAAYARYQFTPRFAMAARAEYLSDRGGMFSGTTQALKETTLSGEYKIAEGFTLRPEWRRDFSNQPFALSTALGVLKKQQSTATVGLVWWFGGKTGGW